MGILEKFGSGFDSRVRIEHEQFLRKYAGTTFTIANLDIFH